MSGPQPSAAPPLPHSPQGGLWRGLLWKTCESMQGTSRAWPPVNDRQGHRDRGLRVRAESLAGSYHWAEGLGRTGDVSDTPLATVSEDMTRSSSIRFNFIGIRHIRSAIFPCIFSFHPYSPRRLVSFSLLSVSKLKYNSLNNLSILQGNRGSESFTCP